MLDTLISMKIGPSIGSPTSKTSPYGRVFQALALQNISPMSVEGIFNDCSKFSPTILSVGVGDETLVKGRTTETKTKEKRESLCHTPGHSYWNRIAIAITGCINLVYLPSKDWLFGVRV